MSDGKITSAELQKMFGSEMPWAVANLLLSADGSKTLAEVREDIRKLAGSPARWKAREIVQRLCSDPEMWATHGLPPEHKIQRLEDEFTAAIEASQAEALDRERGEPKFDEHMYPQIVYIDGKDQNWWLSLRDTKQS
jgi:D-alanyl-D-alanine carboxypeptidase